MASDSTTSRPRVTEEERWHAEVDQARVGQFRRFLKERRRHRRRVVAVTTAAAGMLLLAGLAGWHLRGLNDKATSAAPVSPAAGTQPIASPVPIEKAPVAIGVVATPAPAAPSVSHEQKAAAKPPGSAPTTSKALKQAKEVAVPPPKFLSRPPSETPVMRPTGQPAPDSATPTTGARLDDDRRGPRALAPLPAGSSGDPRRSSGVESP